MRMLMTLGAGLLCSCSLFEKDKPEEESSETRPQLVGRIASIPAGGDFVLVESYGAWRVPEGGLLSAVGAGGASTLVVTGEKLGQHAAADLRSGVVNIGDPVYYRPTRDRDGPADSVDSPVPGTTETEAKPQKELPEAAPSP